MLSDKDILKAIEHGTIKITPLKLEAVRGCGVLMHLNDRLLIPIPGKLVDPKAKITPDYRELTIPETGYVMNPGDFFLSSTKEYVSLNNEYSLMIEGRSTLARLGLTIVQTAMLVYPGHIDRQITLELCNHGKNPIVLYPGLKIARSVFFKLDSPSSKIYDDNGKYRNQTLVGAPIFNNEIDQD